MKTETNQTLVKNFFEDTFGQYQQKLILEEGIEQHYRFGNYFNSALFYYQNEQRAVRLKLFNEN